jgi:hypothetical protein
MPSLLWQILPLASMQNARCPVFPTCTGEAVYA